MLSQSFVVPLAGAEKGGTGGVNIRCSATPFLVDLGGGFRV